MAGGGLVGGEGGGRGVAAEAGVDHALGPLAGALEVGRGQARLGRRGLMPGITPDRWAVSAVVTSRLGVAGRPGRRGQHAAHHGPVPRERGGRGGGRGRRGPGAGDRADRAAKLAHDLSAWVAASGMAAPACRSAPASAPWRHAHLELDPPVVGHGVRGRLGHQGPARARGGAAHLRGREVALPLGPPATAPARAVETLALIVPGPLPLVWPLRSRVTRGLR